jgi:hypothetical protein
MKGEYRFIVMVVERRDYLDLDSSRKCGPRYPDKKNIKKGIG